MKEWGEFFLHLGMISTLYYKEIGEASASKFKEIVFDFLTCEFLSPFRIILNGDYSNH